MHAQNEAFRFEFAQEAVSLHRPHKPCNSIMAEELTGLQQQLLGALLESGLSKDVLLRACDALYARQAEITESADRAAASNAQHKEKPELCRDLQQTTPGRTDAPKVEEAPKRILTQETRMEAEQQINFLDQMLRMDPWQAAKIIKLYMQQHNIPQREVVESTGLNQSHLSQHLNKGTPMKTNKRAALYTWFENKRKEVVEQYNSPGKRHLSEIESSGGSPSKKSRRNRFKWGPASTNILYQSYEDQKNPSKDEREALVEACNRAECNQRGVPFDNVEGLGPNLVTESRVYNWFANRRKEETFRLKLAIDAANYPETPITAAQGPVTVTRPLGSPTVHTVMSPVIPCPTPTTAVPSMAKPSLPQPGPVDPVTRQQLQQPLLGSSHIGHGQQTAGAHPSQHQGVSTVMGNFVPAVPPPQMPLNIAMMPPPGVPVPTCQVAVQPQMMPASSMGHHQHPVVPGIGQMPVLVSMQPGIDGLPHGMPQLPENVSQIAGAPQLVQMHPVPMTTLPMPPPLQPITCSDIPLPPSLQPISVMSPMVQLPQQPPVPVSIPPNSGNLSGNVNQPQSPIYEVKLDTSVKDVVIEKKDVVTCITTTSIKTKEDVKCGGLKVENGDDDTIIAENVTITTESEEQSCEGSKPSYDVKKENRCSKPIQSPSADDSSCCQSVNKPNGKS